MSNQLETPKAIKFLIAVGGIYISYIYFGLVMERLFNQDYSGKNRPKGTFQKFTFGFATSLFQNLFSFLVAMGVNRYKGFTKSAMDLKSELLLASCNFGSVVLASQALAYVSFPIQALMKSSKIISILIVSFLVGTKAKHTNSQYFCGFIITAGIVIFNLTGKKKHGGDGETTIFGLIVILGSLFCDGLLGTRQGDIKKKYNPSAWDQMESLNKWAGILCFTFAVVSFQFGEFIQFIRDYPAVISDLIILAILGTFGQVFIFYTIFNFSPLILSIITTTRKFFTVLASIVIYHHEINTYQWLSIALVFTGVFVEMLSGKLGKKDEKKELPKYQELDQEAGPIERDQELSRRNHADPNKVD